MISIIRIIIILIIFTLFYSIHYFIISTISTYHNFPFSFRKYSYPVFIIITLSFVTQASYSISVKLYAYIYFFATSYLGLILNCSMGCLFYRMLTLIIPSSMFLGVIITIILPFFFTIYGIIKARNITIDKEITIKTPKYTNTQPIKIAHLSDMHLGAVYQTDFVTKVVDIIIKKINPDIVVITGDLVDSSMNPNLEWFKPFSKITVPILYITGNHEEIVGYEKVFDILKNTNITHIGKNKTGYLFKGINIIGIDYEYDPIRRIKEIEVPDNKVNILLTHVPIVSPEEMKGWGILLLLCGHTHGGQMLPLHITSYLNSKCFKGLYEKFGQYVYVSAGIGTAIFPMRTCSSSTIGVINIENSK